MKKRAMASIAGMVMFIGGCGSSGSSGDSNTTMNASSSMSSSSQAGRFSKTIMMGDTIERDAQTSLEWVGSSGMNGGACQPHGSATTEENDIASAQGHCSALVFAGHDDWRVATPQEHTEYISSMAAAGLTPFYRNPACPRVIGAEKTNASAVNTHNSQPVGTVTPWSVLLTGGSTNFGVKCVREY